MNIILFDQDRENLLPFAYTRPISEFRCGILTLKEKWEKRIPEAKFSFLTEDYLQIKYPVEYSNNNFYISANLLSNDLLVDAIHKLEMESALHAEDGSLLVLRTEKKLGMDTIEEVECDSVSFSAEYSSIDNVWDIFRKNGEQIEADYELITANRESEAIDSTNTLIGNRIFLDKGAKVKAAILNSENGPIYLGKDSEIMEGSVVRGGLALCEGAALKLSTKIYGPTTIGPFSKVGGEVNNSVIFGYSNKGHDGFLGNSVLGEWCNLGADTNVSNLKNNYASIKLWNYAKNGFKDSGLQFCGMMMGDHSKSGINTMFNTATVVGVSANIYGGGFPRNFVPSFSWGGSEKWTTYQIKKAFEVAEKVMERRNVSMTEADKAILSHVFELSTQYRNF